MKGKAGGESAIFVLEIVGIGSDQMSSFKQKRRGGNNF
jgi:hypothetical protein